MSETDNSMALMLGEIRGQVRQIVEQFAVLSAKLDALTKDVSQATHLPDEVQESRARITALDARLTALETIEHQRKGAMTLGAALIKALPWIIPAIAAAGTFAAVSKGMGL